MVVPTEAGRGPQVFGVFNSLLGAVVKNSRIEFDDDWEEKSNVAATGSRLLRCAPIPSIHPLRAAAPPSPLHIYRPLTCSCRGSSPAVTLAAMPTAHR